MPCHHLLPKFAKFIIFVQVFRRSTFSPYLANFASYGKCFISYIILCNCALNCNALKCNALQWSGKNLCFLNLIFWEGIFCFCWVVNFKKRIFYFFWNRSTWFFDDQCKCLFFHVINVCRAIIISFSNRRELFVAKNRFWFSHFKKSYFISTIELIIVFCYRVCY